ncbi:hypothetical protein AVEN_208489-1 [Araneus ventricosus]|uniref:Uncharacterized protein n=1 Tax=Araneus ventricosus TaxID=182803 RepID=A0A4Y2KGR8_ARAVE|nr:hypothetical protein AVEN_80076-1 [Araneus ventricosus]GBN01266.1 hypothetical protein AVEN_208489-1 [Araneus ventricosus]
MGPSKTFISGEKYDRGWVRGTSVSHKSESREMGWGSEALLGKRGSPIENRWRGRHSSSRELKWPFVLFAESLHEHTGGMSQLTARPGTGNV